MTSRNLSSTCNPMRNIRIADEVWKKAKRDAIDHDMTLRDWLTFLILCGNTSDVKAGFQAVDPKV